jgi:tripartite-type tricarboxylate transporter receptor subunit TctC
LTHQELPEDDVRSIVALFATILALAASPAQAQDFPSKPVRILVPFAPGGFVDTAARIVGQKLSERWGQQVVVENRPGGNGFIAVSAAAKAPADGYTLLMAHTGEFVVNPAVFKEVPYDLDRDFAAITLINDAPMIWVVHSESPYRTMQDLMADAKAKPGKIAVSSPGNGSINHLVMEWVGMQTGTKFMHVPYKGGAPAMTAVAAGDVPSGIAALSSAMPHLQSGRVRAIAITTGKRTGVNPSWPTLKEAGIDVQSSIWVGLFAPKGVPQPILDKIYGEVVKTLEAPDVKARFAAGGGEPSGIPSSEFTAQIRREAADAKKVVIAADVRAD